MPIETNFYVALSEDLTPGGARAILERLANPEDDLRKTKDRDSVRATFLDAGVDIAEDLLPEQVVLPPPEEIQRALDFFDERGEFPFWFLPFGPFTPGKAPFKALLLLAAKANQGG